MARSQYTLMDAPDVLKKICAYKVDEVKALKAAHSEAALMARAQAAAPPRGFATSIKAIARTRPALITEIKKASPSKGIIREDFNPVNIAAAYEKGGAACLSVLTDTPGFQGSNAIFSAVRDTTPLPMLRKDFMVDPLQIIESRAMGADCVLIIMAMIDDHLAKDLFDTARALHMDALIEIHTNQEIARGLKLVQSHQDSALMGINNRNLRTFETCLSTFKTLAPLIPETYTLIAESGINTRKDIEELSAHGASGFLIGESLMRQDNIEIATRAFS